MIRVEHLVKRYGNRYALNDVSFEIGEGEVVGLLGPNGAGKSTTMNILTGFLSATEGTVTIDGVSMGEDPLHAKCLIGYLPEQPPVYGDMTVDEYLNFVFDLKRCQLDRRAHLDEVCTVVKLSDVRRRLIRNLSKGYRQRVGIAGAIIGDPGIIILDEPTVGLDPKQILEIRNLIRLLGKKHTVILSTHILAEAQAVCGRILVINRGRVLADEKTEDLARIVEENRYFRYAICGKRTEVLPALRSAKGVRYADVMPERDGDALCYLIGCEAADPRRDLFALCAAHGWQIIGIEPVGGDLESVFIKLIDRADGNAAAPETKRRGN